ncbi:MAG: hypothetical protein RBR62_04085 [Bacteroidales bacterium]|nr:hypothetical protein [Bacteroidales bacterium]HHV40057.1 gliding motility lipoprotein GldH [Bacteroidales bacterium]
MFPNKHRWLFVLLPALFLTLCRCTPPSSAHMQIAFPSSGWNKDQPLEMHIQVPDSTAAYNVFIDIRTTNKYTYPYVVLLIGRGHQFTPDTLWLPLLPEQAIRSGAFLDYRFPVHPTSIQAEGPVMYWKLQHSMPTQTIQGIVKTGLLLKKHTHGKK